MSTNLPTPLKPTGQALVLRGYNPEIHHKPFRLLAKHPIKQGMFTDEPYTLLVVIFVDQPSIISCICIPKRGTRHWQTVPAHKYHLNRFMLTFSQTGKTAKTTLIDTECV